MQHQAISICNTDSLPEMSHKSIEKIFLLRFNTFGIQNSVKRRMTQSFYGSLVHHTQLYLSQVGLDVESESMTHYKNLLVKLPEGSLKLDSAYEAVDKLVAESEGYVGVWLRYQALWDLQPDYLYLKLGNNLSQWMKTLEEIKWVGCRIWLG